MGKEIGTDGQTDSATLGGENNLTLTTLASDSSPFRDKYELDEDGDIIGEVSYHFILLSVSQMFKCYL